ncbi:hypothetical protein C5167_030385 [Papaver somniferum]|nr:hypothetical protein C5167_030385 [Papaver somniferum]
MKLGVMTDHRVREDYSRDSVAVIDVIANSEDDNTWDILVDGYFRIIDVVQFKSVAVEAKMAVFLKFKGYEMGLM